ncbi:MAG: radical SAM protein [Thermoplasmata archaeon]|nr:radical SAM protein [Thermoplasmata archaeon]
MSSILYRYGRNFYINLTNRCPCNCTFCYRFIHDSIGDSDSLWLKEEPTADEVMAAIAEAGVTASDSVVFCGFGEPTERMDVLVEVARRVRSEVGSKLRLDTNGLGNLVNGRDILPELAEVLDAISISLNASDAEEYGRVTRCRFDPETAYAGLLDFIKRSKELIGDVTVSVVGGSISEESEERCRAIADQMQVRFRVR